MKKSSSIELNTIENNCDSVKKKKKNFSNGLY